MNARDALVEALEAMGADGLCNIDLECGCGLDDLAPCEFLDLDECVPATCITRNGAFYPMEPKP